MIDLHSVQIPKIEDDVLFEELCCDIFKNNPDYANVNRNGRPGQKQDGVDVFARKVSTSAWHGVQCKVRSTNASFSEKELQTEIDQAKNFNPTLKHYYLYTTLSRDAKTQEIVRKLTDQLLKENAFSFEVLFWEDIADVLRQPQNMPIYFKYYKQFFRDNTTFGHSIGKLMNLNLDFDNKSDTHYEIILGKIPIMGDDFYNANYYRGTYFIANLNDKKLEFFTSTDGKASCVESDIMDAFKNQIDCHRIVKWLRTIENLDNFIYNDEHTVRFSITTEERNNYLKDEYE